MGAEGVGTMGCAVTGRGERGVGKEVSSRATHSKVVHREIARYVGELAVQTVGLVNL